MQANVDRFFSGKNMGLECKTASAYNADKWTGDSVPANYEILQKMVSQVNENEVPEEDVLSNGIYKYSRQDCRINLIK